MSISQRVSVRVRLVLILVLCVAVLSYAAIASTSSNRASAASYCGIWVAGYHDCANESGGSWINGYLNENWSHNQDYVGYSVCEHAYIAGTGTTVSNHCEINNAYSFCDLYYYYKHGYELSAHAVNNQQFSELIWGHARVVEERTCS